MILLIVLLVSMADAGELKIEGLSDNYMKGDIITFTVVAEEGLASEDLKEWDIAIKIDGATKIDIPVNNEEKRNVSEVTSEKKAPFCYGYGPGNADLFADMGKNEILITIDSSMLNRGDHVATLYLNKEEASETYAISTEIKIT